MSREGTAPARDPSRGEFDELRGLLLGPEREDIRQLKQSLASARSAEDIGRVLPQAVRLASQRDRELRSALQPVIEQSIRASARGDPRLLGDALSPIIGEAVKHAVASALRRLNQSLEQTIEKSLTSRALLWRFEAIRTGRPFGEIVLLRSLLYRVEQVFLIHRETGLLLIDKAAEVSVINDADLVSAMLTAIQDFVKDTLGSRAGDAVEAIEAGEFVIWIQQSPQLILAGLIRGAPPKALKGVFESVLQNICSAHADALVKFNGDVSPFRPCQKDLAACFIGKGKKARRRVVSWPTAAAAVCAVILIAGCLYIPMRSARRWQKFVGALRREPGIIVIDSNKHDGKYFISGLRDPLARNPAALLLKAGFSPDEVVFAWQGYLSMQPPFAAIHEFDEVRKSVENRKIHFRLDSSQLSPEQTDNVADAAAGIRALLQSALPAGKNIEIEVAGHADISGTEARNEKLSEERAETAIASLTAAGVPFQALLTRAAGTTTNQGAPDGDWNRAYSRCVSFRVVPVQP
jgi:outer membrane protein OmpA-like peptidoglycan-associated protein